MSSLLVLGKGPRLKPLSAKRSTVVSVLDIGSSKVVCMIARLKPIDSTGVLLHRTHTAELMGIGHQRSLGVKAGAIIDMEAAEQSIRLAVDAAERMAGVTIDSLIVNLSAGRMTSEAYAASVSIGGHEIEYADIHRVLEAGSAHSVREGRSVVHALPIGYTLDSERGIREPRGMLGDTLGVDMHVVTADSAPVRNLLLCIERCHLQVDAVVATPYASGLAALVDDEAEMGVAVLDLGGGTTTMAVFHEGRFIHADAVPVGGNHVTMDIARGLATPLAHAEMLKIKYGSALPCPSDEREFLSVPHVGEDSDVPNEVPRSQLVRIIRPRIEETIEMVRDRLIASGYAQHAGKCVVLTGGAAQLNGLGEGVRRILGRQVRIGRPLGISGLPESAKAPAFATAVGLAVYPQVAQIEQFEPRRIRFMKTGTGGGYISRMGAWIKESF